MTDRDPGPGPQAAARLQAAKLSLLRLTASGGGTAESSWSPAWSSALLERTVDEIAMVPGGHVHDVLRGLWEALGQTGAELTETMANFIKDIVVACFTRFRQQYEHESQAWMVKSVAAGCTEAQAYLALHALPEPELERCREQLLSALRASPFEPQARRMLEEDRQ
jgi:hypothetical protein